MNKLFTAMMAGAFAAFAAPETASAQSACDVYSVQRGDTLRKIARSAYGDDEISHIYDANRTEIGKNPNIIEIGTVLRLPCADGALPEHVATVPAEIGNSAATFTFITANGYRPYADESLPGQGMTTSLVERAMIRAQVEKNVEIVFVNDWAAHLEALLPSLAFDASFPWTRPACEKQSRLTAVESYACQYYDYSDPLYEIVDGFFALSDSDFIGATSFTDLQGASICRPEGYPTGHLEQQGLMPPTTKLTQPSAIEECFDQLMAGRVDVIALDTRSGELAISELGLANEVLENPNLNVVTPLQVAVHRSNPESRELIETLNLGLRIMRQSGEWRDIVSEGLQEQMETLIN